MIEKWTPVLLIVGCILLVFVICLPIDFYLYRRRKRLERERKNTTMRRPLQTTNKAVQNHEKVTVTKESAETDCSETNEMEQRKYHAQRGVSKFLNMLKNKASIETLKFQERLADRISVEMETETADKHVNIYSEEENCANELTGSSKEKNIYSYSYDDDYLEYSPQKQFSNVSKTLNENEEFIDDKKRSHLGVRYDKKMAQLRASNKKKKSHFGAHHGKKKSRLRALEPLENTSVLGETSYKKCVTNPSRSRNGRHFEPVNIVDVNYKDDVRNNDKSHKEIVLERSTRSHTTKLTEDDTDAVLNCDNKTAQIVKEKASKAVQRDTSSPFQTEYDAEDKPFKSHKMLTHSKSEQCMLVTGKGSASKRSHRNGRKHNVVSPVRKNAFIFSEGMHKERNNLSERAKPIFIPAFSEHSLTPKVKRKKKTNPVWKKQCSDSMPELHYGIQKY